MERRLSAGTKLYRLAIGQILHLIYLNLDTEIESQTAGDHCHHVNYNYIWLGAALLFFLKFACMHFMNRIVNAQDLFAIDIWEVGLRPSNGGSDNRANNFRFRTAFMDAKSFYARRPISNASCNLLSNLLSSFLSFSDFNWKASIQP